MVGFFFGLSREMINENRLWFFFSVGADQTQWEARRSLWWCAFFVFVFGLIAQRLANEKLYKMELVSVPVISLSFSLKKHIRRALWALASCLLHKNHIFCIFFSLDQQLHIINQPNENHVGRNYFQEYCCQKHRHGLAVILFNFFFRCFLLVWLWWFGRIVLRARISLEIIYGRIYGRIPASREMR